MVNEYQKAYRESNKDRLKHQRLKRYEEWRLKLLELVGNSVCKDCGHSDTRVLQFDHVRGDKVAPVMSCKTWDRMKEEALKCEVVCANCHVLRTRSRFTEHPDLVDTKWVRLSKTQCPNGHEYTLENTKYHKNGARRCSTCCRERSYQSYLRNK